MPSKLMKLSPKMAKRLRKQSPRQWNIVKTVRSAGLPVRVYKRAGKVGGNRSKVSVHNPFLDFDRPARVSNRSARKYPQAYDTRAQGDAKRRGFFPFFATRGKGKGKRVTKNRRVLLP